jgi:hypothetical protein
MAAHDHFRAFVFRVVGLSPGLMARACRALYDGSWLDVQNAFSVRVRAAEYIACIGEQVSTVRPCERYPLHTRGAVNGYRVTQRKLIFAVTGLNDQSAPHPWFTTFLTLNADKFPVMILYFVLPADSRAPVCNDVLSWLWALRERMRSMPSSVIFTVEDPRGLGPVWRHIARP